MKTFDSTENLYCVVTKSHKAAVSLLRILKELTDRGYNAWTREINGGFYVIREFKPEELNDKTFTQVYGEYIQEKEGRHVFNTKTN